MTTTAGNLTQKVDAIPKTTTYVYDAFELPPFSVPF